MAAAIGAGLPVEEPSGSMVVDIGGGTSEVAVISLGGIVTSKSLRVAGDEFDESIVHYIKKVYNLMIGERTAEEIKLSIGCAIPRAKEEKFEVRGRDLVSGLPKNVTITSTEIAEALKEPVNAIIESIKYNPIKINNVVEQLPEYDVLILIPKGSFKYFSTFINEDNKEKVMIWEIHANRNVTGNMKLYCKDLHNKKVLIVDNIYSGKTMKIIKDLVIQEGGHPITLGLFPKSSSAINQLDYFMVLNKVYNSKEFINEKNWYIKYYTDAIKE
jgi:hypoxanthine-guanine phosphoribosyltransferase